MPKKTNSIEPRKSRLTRGHTLPEAAASLGVKLRTWEDWEYGVTEMPSPLLKLYRHLAGIERIPFTSHQYQS